MKYSFLFVNFLGIALWGVSGVIDSNTTWTKANSPYLITDNVLVGEGITLTVESGVVVKFAPSTYLKVEGHIKAEGSGSEHIIFESNSSNPSNSDWGGIKIRPTSGSSTSGQGYLSGSILKRVTIKDAELGVYIYSTGFYIESCNFDNNKEAIEIRATNGVVIRDSNFTNNQKGITSVYSDYSSGDNVSRIATTWITGNSFTNNQTGVGLNMNQRDFKDLFILANSFNHGGTAISFGGGGYGPRVHSVYINSNKVQNHTTGINLANVYGSASQDAETMGEYPLTCWTNILLNNSNGMLVSASNLKYSIIKNIIVGPKGIAVSSSGGNDLYEGNTIIVEEEAFSLSGSSSYHPSNLTIDGNLLISGNERSGPFFDLLWGSGHKIVNNNILATGEVLKIGTSNDANATGNYWGRTTLDSIRELTSDYYDDFEKGKALVEPFEVTLRTDVPLMPPDNVEKIGVAGGVKISWEANAESDVTGYRVHYGSPSGYGYANVVNVGTDLNYTITGASLDDEISVTAYDGGASNLSDVNSVTVNQFNLTESWFSKAITIGYFIQPAAGSGGTVTGSDTYEDGDTATFTANASNEYKFLKWVVGQSEYQTSTIQLVINGPLQLNAIFEKDLNDNDQDGISNYDEIVTYQTNPNESDTDNDSLSDGDELNLGTDPKVADTKIVNFFEQIALSREKDSRNKGYQEGYNKGFQDGNASGITFVTGSPDKFSLFTEDEMVGWMELSYDAGVLEGNETGIDHVLKNPQRYNLFKEQFITDSIESSRSVYELKARKEGEQAVLDNPALFGLKLLDEEFKVTPYTKSWFFDEHLGWLWTNHQVFPYIYKAEKKSEPSAWLFFEQATYPPKFYNYETKEWFELSE